MIANSEDMELALTEASYGEGNEIVCTESQKEDYVRNAPDTKQCRSSNCRHELRRVLVQCEIVIVADVEHNCKVTYCGVFA